MTNQREIKIGDFVFNSGILGSLEIFIVDSIYDGINISAHSISTDKTELFYDEYSWLKKIDNVIDHLVHNWLSKTATGILNKREFSFCDELYRRMATVIALKTLDHWKKSDDWKERISGKMWKFRDYYQPQGKYRIREARSFRKNDHQYNGQNFWAVINPSGERGEWTDLITCLKRIDEFPVKEKY